FVPAPPVPQPPSVVPAPPIHPPPPRDDEPLSKKMKSEDNLIPEEEFLRRNKGPVAVKVQVPNMQDKSEWKLSGQVLNFTVPLTDQVVIRHQSQNPRSYGHAGRETEAAVRGHFHQGFQLSGLLQHEQWCSHSLGTEGERRKKEVIHATTKTFT
ncbi:unnamed protein product, partial [Tetraodon nigroviridis]